MLRFFFVCLFLTQAATFADDRPNVILIMADDVGIEGLGCYGGVSYRTPNLDRMAEQGMRFTHAYSQPLCTPTRVQLMTGKYNHRNWRSFGILDPNEKTFGHAISEAGYKTAIIGKWQLQSYDPPDLPGAEKRRGTGMHPKNSGFDQYALFHALHTEDKGSRYANPSMLEGKAGQDGKLKTYDGGYGPDVWVQKILDFMADESKGPKFVYYPMALPHWPFQPTPHSEQWDPKSEQPTELKYATDMIEYMDTAVGRLLDGLKQGGHDKNTAVIFYSDNGTHRKVFSKLKDGRMIRGGKTSSQQTGIHVPLIVRWPEAIAAGSVCDDIVDASDFFPTLLDLAGAKPPNDDTRDGVSFAPQLFGKDGTKRKFAFFWYDPRPGWDKERYRRHVFALNKTHKLFRNGRLFRLGQHRVLEETAVDPLKMNDLDRAAAKELAVAIESTMSGVQEPPRVDAYGNPEHEFDYMPKSRQETNRINDGLFAGSEQFIYGDESIPEHRLWIFNPLGLQKDELRPCVFLIHGGGWGGSPGLLAAQAVYLQRRGYNAAVIHFRKPAKAVTPADTLRDARRAYRWLVKHGRQHHIDVSRMVVSGGSAGGHLSLALLTIPLDDDPVIQTFAPKGLVLFNPVIDLVDGWPGGRKKCEANGIDPKSFSPAHHVVAGLPKTLVMSGELDSIITPKMLDAFQKRMIDRGNDCWVTIYPKAGHGFFNYGREQNVFFQQTMWQFDDFLADLFPDAQAPVINPAEGLK